MTPNETSLLILDLDGVGNGHDADRHPNGYCGLNKGCVAQLNRILKTVPEARIVLSTSWRYIVLGEQMTLKGFEAMLLSHGVECHDKIIGLTGLDSEIWGNCRSYAFMSEYGARIRRIQILRWLYGMFYGEEHTKKLGLRRDDDRRWCVLDDIDLDLPGRQVVTDKNVGLTEADADRAISILKGQPLR